MVRTTYLVNALLELCDLYGRAESLQSRSLAVLIWDDSRLIDRLREGGDVATRRWQYGMAWLSAHWPDELAWPNHIERPPPLPVDEMTQRAVKRRAWVNQPHRTQRAMAAA